jgi:hypothetical protein
MSFHSLEEFRKFEAEMQDRDDETLRRHLLRQRPRPGFAVSYRELWRKYWPVIVLGSLMGALLFGAAMWVRAL